MLKDIMIMLKRYKINWDAIAKKPNVLRNIVVVFRVRNLATVYAFVLIAITNNSIFH
jgi:hypothetical protein